MGGNQASETEWELNLGFIHALFAVRIFEAATNPFPPILNPPLPK